VAVFICYYIPMLFFLLFMTVNFLFPPPVLAQCPVCIVTVGGGMLLAKKLGIDDLLVSIWISALNTALAFWLAPKIKKLSHPYLLSLIFYLLSLAYFKFTDQLGHPANRLLGVDKIFLGQTVGFFVLGLANHAYLYLKKRLARPPFPYAKVVFPTAAIFLVTVVFKLIFHL